MKVVSIVAESLHCTIIHIYSTPTDCQRTACSYLLNARIACIVCCRTSVVTKLSVPIQYITGSWQIQWSICYHTHQVHWLTGKWLQIGAQCVKEVVRFQDAYHSFQKVLSGLLTSLTCSFLKLTFSLWHHSLFINISRKTGHVIKDLFLWEWGFRVSSPLFPREILGQIVIENEQWKNETAQSGEFYFKNSCS